MDSDVDDVLVEFDCNGSLPTTHETQGSDMGLFGGLMGWEATDVRLPGSAEALRQKGVRIRIETVDSGDPHPSTYRLTLQNARERHSLIALSTGGGMMEVITVDGFKVSMFGDYFETLLWTETHGRATIDKLGTMIQADEEAIKTARRVGDQLPRELRCTALGGLSITPMSQTIEQKLTASRSQCGCH